MEMLIGDKYRVTADSYNYTLEKYEDVVVKGVVVRQDWKVVGYYSRNLGHLLDRIIFEEVKDNDKLGLMELVNAINETRHWLTQEVDGQSLELLKKCQELENEVKRLKKKKQG